MEPRPLPGEKHDFLWTEAVCAPFLKLNNHEEGLDLTLFVKHCSPENWTQTQMRIWYETLVPVGPPKSLLNLYKCSFLHFRRSMARGHPQKSTDANS